MQKNPHHEDAEYNRNLIKDKLKQQQQQQQQKDQTNQKNQSSHEQKTDEQPSPSQDKSSEDASQQEPPSSQQKPQDTSKQPKPATDHDVKQDKPEQDKQPKPEEPDASPQKEQTSRQSEAKADEHQQANEQWLRLIGQLLPTWQFPEPTGFNSYPEKAVVDNTVRQQALFGRSDIKVTYLLNKVGRITLPAYSIPWFNTLMGKEERVSLPARTIEVLPRKGAAHPSTAVLHPPMVKLSNPSMLGHRWGWWMAAGFALAWALMLLGWWLFKSFIHRRREKSLAWKHLRQACAKHKPLEAQAALLRWASLQWPSFKGVTLDQLARKMNDASVQEALTDLSKVLYGTSNPTPWQGDFLWQSLTVYLRKKPTPRVHADDLPPINPQQ